MLKLELSTLVNGIPTQNFSNQITTSLEKYLILSDRTLQKIANLVKQGVDSNLQGGKDIFGNSVAPKKIPNGRPIFQNSGQLLNSVVQQQVGKGEWNIFINSNRSEIASYLQTGTARMTPRQFFGISDTTDKQIDNILDQSFSNP